METNMLPAGSIGYEHLKFSNSDYPVIFHLDELGMGELYQNPLSKAVPNHWHEDVEILCIKSGRAIVRTYNGEDIYGPGDIAVISSGHFHDICPAGESTKYFCLIAQRDFLRDYGINVEESIFTHKIQDNELLEYFQKMYEEVENKRGLYKVRILSYVMLIYEKIYSNYTEINAISGSESKPSYEISKGVLKYINKNYKNKIDIDSIAKDLNISKYYMCHCFKECIGYGITEFLNIYRIDRARKMLVSNKGSISEVAEKCGFSNMSYFTRTFKKITGFLPSEIKNKRLP